jgi:TRAP-type C4-dicarboxylate transport system permease small subunit
MEKFARSVDKISKAFSLMAMFALFGMMILGTADVAGRYLFNKPIIGTLEIFEMLLPLLILFSMSDTQSIDEHLTAGVIDFFHFKPETRTKIRFGVQLLVFCLFLLIIWRGVGGSMFALRSHRSINNIELPLWIPQLVVPLGALVMCMVLVVQMVETANKIRRKT